MKGAAGFPATPALSSVREGPAFLGAVSGVQITTTSTVATSAFAP